MHIHFLTHPEIGPARHASNRGLDSVLGLQRHLLGMAAFAIGIEEAWGRARMSEIKAVDWPVGIDVL
jgi:RNA-directed DNA polymerase